MIFLSIAIFIITYFVFAGLFKTIGSAVYVYHIDDADFNRNSAAIGRFTKPVCLLFIAEIVCLAGVIFINLFTYHKAASVSVKFGAAVAVFGQMFVLIVMMFIKMAVKKITASNISGRAERKTVVSCDLAEEQDGENKNKKCFQSCNMDCRQGYRSIADFIIKSRKKIFVFTAQNQNKAVLSVSINCALRLAKDGYKILLADCDYENAAVSKVFDFSKRPKGRSFYPAAVKNLFVSPDFAKENFSRSFQLLAENFDYLLLYMPNGNSGQNQEILRQGEIELVL